MRNSEFETRLRRGSIASFPFTQQAPMTDRNSRQDFDFEFERGLNERLADLRMRVDLGEVPGRAAFRAALEHDGRFRLDDPRVWEAVMHTGLGPWTA